MAYSTINKSTDYFNNVLYTGNASARTITTDMQPDMVWTKARNAAHHGIITDATTGAGKRLRTSVTNAQDTNGSSVASFISTGYTLTDNATINGNGETNVSWSWKGGGGQGSSNTDGTINTTYTSANTTSGFSISQYTGTGSAATIGHGLGAIPKMIIVKRIDSTSQWSVYHESVGNTKHVILNSTAVQVTSSAYWNDTSPTASVFSIGSGTDVNASGGTYVAYCWAQKTGFSAFGKYLGNYQDNGPFVYTGIKPKFILIRQYNDTGQWRLYDTKREIHGQGDLLKYLAAESSATEVTTTDGGLDILSNGFKIRSSGGNHDLNGNQDPYLYMAFGQTLVSSNNVPTTAR